MYCTIDLFMLTRPVWGGCNILHSGQYNSQLPPICSKVTLIKLCSQYVTLLQYSCIAGMLARLFGLSEGVAAEDINSFFYELMQPVSCVKRAEKGNSR